MSVVHEVRVDHKAVGRGFRLVKGEHYRYLGPKNYRMLVGASLLVWDDRLGRQEIIVPSGFEFDGASIPKWLRWLIEDEIEDPRIFLASLFHDLMYVQRDRRGKRFADRAFCAVMVWQGMPAVKAELRHTGVSGLASWVMWLT